MRQATSTYAARLTMTDQERDRGCVERMRGGELRAFEELYDRHNGLLYSVALRIVKTTAAAEDAVREAWIRIWRSAGAYTDTRGTVGAWLVGMLRSVAIERIRSEALRPATGAPAPSATEDASANAAHRQMSERVGRALDKLGPQHRQVLELAYFGGLSQTQIAERLNEPIGNVQSWTRQGLVRLSDLVPQEDWT